MALITLLLLACKPDPAGAVVPRGDSEPLTVGGTGDSASTPDTATGSRSPAPPTVVLVIGDGMGPNHLVAGSAFVTGSPSGLAIQGLPIQGTVRTASLTGITDSAAAGTALATGVVTHNDRIALDRDGLPVTTLVELARDHGWATGVVTSSRLPHATPAAFTAHHPLRDEEFVIAELQIGAADVMLGGGWAYFEGASVPGSLRTDAGLLDAMAAAGVTWVRDVDQLATAPLPVMGAFAPGHLSYVAGRPAEAPTLPELVSAAIAHLEADPEGLLLIVEGARIDHASHANDMARMVEEVAELDAVVAQLAPWVASRDGALVVTADHDCGGLDGVRVGAVGQVPDGAWRWGNHSNAPVTVSAQGVGLEGLEGAEVDARALHALLAERIDGQVRTVPPTLVPDGTLNDLGLVGPVQLAVSSVGDDQGRLGQLSLDADAYGLAIGIEGVFPWATHSLVVLLDLDGGPGAGFEQLSGQIDDETSPVDFVLSALRVATPGHGVDAALVSVGGIETPYLPPLRGVRRIGADGSLTRAEGALNYHVGSRTTLDAPRPVVVGRGFEALVPWSMLWPQLGGSVPREARISISAVLTTLTGEGLTNQALPSFPAGTPAPAGAATLGMVTVAVDPDGDGIGGDPVLLP